MPQIRNGRLKVYDKTLVGNMARYVENIDEINFDEPVRPSRLGLLICDMQEGNRWKYKDWEKIVRDIVCLQDLFDRNCFPILACEDPNPTLGRVDPRIRIRIHKETDIYKRTEVSAFSGGFFDCLKSSNWIGVKTIVVVGVEAHVTVEYTANELVSAGYNVILIDGAVGSKTDWEKKFALTRLSCNRKIFCTAFDQFLFMLYGGVQCNLFYEIYKADGVVHPILSKYFSIFKEPRYNEFVKRFCLRNQEELTGEERFMINFHDENMWCGTKAVNYNIEEEAEEAFNMFTDPECN